MLPTARLNRKRVSPAQFETQLALAAGVFCRVANRLGGRKVAGQAAAAEAAPQTPGEAVCEPCDTFAFNQTFPMYVMKMSTFFDLNSMLSYEEMVADGRVFKWEPSMGDRVFFISHQWTSFSHPDPKGEQLRTAQQLLRTIGDGKLRDIFATQEEYEAYYYKEVNRFMQFPKASPEVMAEEVGSGYVWLDFASVPQSQGNRSESERIHRETLEVRRRVLGPEHRDTLVSASNLASVLRRRGGGGGRRLELLEEAVRIQRETLQLRQSILGNEHPDSLASASNLANLAGV